MLKSTGELRSPKLAQTLALIGGKWQSTILDTLGAAPLRYNKLRLSLPEISEKILLQELKKLIDLGAIERSVCQQSPMWVEYSLTPKGQRVLALIAHMQAVEDSLNIN